MGGWLGLSLRQLLFILPTLCMAISQGRLSPLRGATARVVVAAAVVAAWGSLHPAALSAATGGLHPWLRLSAAEALAALLLAAGAASVLDALQTAGLIALRWALPAKTACSGGAASRLGVLVVACASLVHPAAAALCGCLCLAVRLAAAGKEPAGAASGMRGADGTRALAWFMFHGQLVLLPCAGLYSWLASGTQHSVEWSDGRLLVAALAFHAVLLCPAQPSPRSQQGGDQRWRRATLAAVHEAAAVAAAACCLWGHPSVLLYSACWSAAVEGARA